MKVKILDERESSTARILLNKDERLIAQAGSLVAMRGNVTMNTIFRRSLPKSQSQTAGTMGTESLFLTEFRGLGDKNEVWLAPSMIGNIIIHQVTDYKLVMVASAYLACSGTMDLFFGVPDLKLPANYPYLTLLSLAGKGQVLLNGLGAIYPIDVQENYWVNLDNLVAFDNSLKYEVMPLKTKGLQPWWRKGQLFIKFTGEGRLYCQTHQAKDWGHLIAMELKSK
ncbi:TIGR00266 family protein [Crocosphaera sp.]|uniref:TIGR00266 family protein n=1 Tax=Crocosphaera sp. TaxID=2729996 RepID=UPI003F28E359|nr:TIGR00266 family protein [Crocosphaera sp.]